MILLIAGASHTGKTLLAQRLLEKYGYPYLSIDHLKMGLIRSGYTSLTPESCDRELTDYLWPVVREIIKTYASAIEHRGDDEDCALESLIRDNTEVLEQCRKYGVEYTLIDGTYQVDIGGGTE